MSSLITDEGYFHQDATLLERNAADDEIRIELESQIQSAIVQDIDPTHLDSHGGVLWGYTLGEIFRNNI